MIISSTDYKKLNNPAQFDIKNKKKNKKKRKKERKKKSTTKYCFISFIWIACVWSQKLEMLMEHYNGKLLIE